MYINTTSFASTFLSKKQNTTITSSLQKNLEKIANHVNEKQCENQKIEQKNFENVKKETIFVAEQQQQMQSIEDIVKVDDKTTLKEFVAMLCSASRTADNYCQEIEQFQDALQQFDKEIQSYQDMINDPSKLKDGLTIADAMDYLEQIKQKKQDYVKQKSDEFQNRSEFHTALLKGTLGCSNIVSQKELDSLLFHNTDDVSQELERISKGIHTIKNSIADTLKNIMDKLEQKGESTQFILYNKNGQKDDITLQLWQLEKKQSELNYFI